MTTTVDVEPQPRIDTLVLLTDGTQARRTEYAGTAWFDGKPFVSGLSLQRSRTALRGIRTATFESGFFVPDSLAYHRDRLGGASLSLTTALAAAGDVGAVLASSARFVDDPSGAPTWIHLHLQAHIGWPAGVAYRLVALTPVDAVR